MGLPFGTWIILREKRPQLQNKSVKERYGFLYNGFTPSSYYWEIVSVLRKEIIAAISAFLIQEGTLVQSLGLLLLIFCFILLALKVKPYERPLLNSLELASLFVLELTVFCGVFFLSAGDPSSQYFQHGKNCKSLFDLVVLDEWEKWLLFVLILMANLWFFTRVAWSVMGDMRSSLRGDCPRFYLCCCLCMNRGLFKTETKVHKE